MNSQLCVDCQHCIFSEICKECMFTQNIPIFNRAFQRKVFLSQGRALFNIGDKVKYLIAIRSGCLKIIDQDNILLNLQTPGQLIGGEDLHNGYYRTSAIALQDTEVCMLDYSEIYGLSQITLGTFRNMVNLLSETAYENQQMIKVLVQPDAFLKVTSFILLMAERNKIKFFTEDNFSLPLTQKDLSSLLGISPVTLRRVLDKLERDVGGITIHDRKVVIKDIAQVRRSIRLHLMS